MRRVQLTQVIPDPGSTQVSPDRQCYSLAFLHRSETSGRAPQTVLVRSIMRAISWRLLSFRIHPEEFRVKFV